MLVGRRKEGGQSKVVYESYDVDCLAPMSDGVCDVDGRDRLDSVANTFRKRLDGLTQVSRGSRSQ